MSIHEKIIKEIEERRQLGLEKYGVSVDNAELTKEQRLQHLKEEMLDAVVYIQAFLDSKK